MEFHRGFEGLDIEDIESAMCELSELADRSCFCEDIGTFPTGRNPCEKCIATRALERLERVVRPRIESASPERLRSLDERIYVEEWQRVNQRVLGLNHGYGTLELLLARRTRPHPLTRNPEPVVEHVSQRDWMVSTSVVQWLGTNVGCSFINECELRVSQEKGVQRRFGTNGLDPLNYEVDASVEDVSRQIAENYISKQEFPGACGGLARSISSAIHTFMGKKDG